MSKLTLKTEVRALSRLAGPLIVAQGGVTLMGVVDALIIGQVSAMEMAAVSLGNSLVGMFSGLGIGIALGIEPLVGQAYGAKRPKVARSWLWQGLWLSLLLSPFIICLVVAAGFMCEPFGISDALSERARAYIWPRLPGVPIILWAVGTRAYLSNIGRARPALYAACWSNVLNVFVDLALVHGWFGLPKLGAEGISWATTICFGLVVLIQAGAIGRIWRRKEDEGPNTIHFEPISMKHGRKIFHTGWPIGMHLLVEIGIFSAVSALIARFGEVELAAHQIALSLASVAFMCAVGIANATTSRVGNHVGAGSSENARQAGFVGMALGGGFMLFSGTGLFLGANALALAFTNDENVVPFATEMVRIAGVFALADGLQAVAAGALRGAGDTRWPFYANAGAHWVIGLPTGYVLSTQTSLGVAGFWWGLTLGLCLVAVVLIARFSLISRGPIKRLTLPPP